MVPREFPKPEERNLYGPERSDYKRAPERQPPESDCIMMAPVHSTDQVFRGIGL